MDLSQVCRDYEGLIELLAPDAKRAVSIRITISGQRVPFRLLIAEGKELASVLDEGILLNAKLLNAGYSCRREVRMGTERLFCRIRCSDARFAYVEVEGWVEINGHSSMTVIGDTTILIEACTR